MGNLVKIKLLNDLRITLQWIYEWNIPPERPLIKGRFPATVIWVVLGGRKNVDIGGAQYELCKGDVVIIPPATPRSGTSESESFGFFHYITLSADIRVGALDFAKIYRLPTVANIADSDHWDELVQETREILKQSDRLLEGLQLDSRWTKTVTEEAKSLSTMQSMELIDVQRSFYQWFSFLCRLLKRHIPDEPLITDSRIQDICAYIKSNLSRELPPTELASVAYISESHLRLLFRKTFGISPTEYVRKERIQYARELLLNSDYRLSDIARMVGYEDASRFSRIFSKSEGISAMAYRKQYQNHVK